MLNLKLALRALVKTPFVTVVAIVSLALAIGPNPAIFSLFNPRLLRPLPVPEANRLVNLAAPGPKPGSTSCSQAGDCDTVFSYAMFRDLERIQTPFTGIAAHVTFAANLASGGQTQNGEGLLVSGNYFPVLGLKPAIGRLLDPDDDRTPGESHVVVLSYAYWQTRFALDQNVLNQPLTVNGQTMTIVGVARGEGAAHAPARRHGVRAAHRVRQHREPAARARRGARRRDGRPPVDRRGPRATRQAAARRVVPPRPPRRRRRPRRCEVDAEPDGRDAAEGGDRHGHLRDRPDRHAVRRSARRRHGPALRAVSRAPQHAARSRLGVEGAERSAVWHAVGGALPHLARDSADRAFDGAARVGRAVHQKSGQRAPRRSGRQGGQRDHVPDFPGAEWLHAGAVAPAVRARRGRAGRTARRDGRHQLHGAAAERQQLG